MARSDCMDASWEKLELFGEPVIFTEERIDRNSVPEGLFMYEVRHNSEDWGEPCEIQEHILVNFLGTVISDKPIEFGNDGYCMIDSEEDWWYLGEYSSISEYVSDNRHEKNKDYER